MKYIRTKDGRFIKIYSKKEYEKAHPEFIDVDYFNYDKWYALTTHNIDILKQADTIEELIQIGDIVFYWSSSDDKEHCIVINYDTELYSIKYNAITKLLIPVGEDYKCVAKGYPSFNLIKNRRYLVNKGELELL